MKGNPWGPLSGSTVNGDSLAFQGIQHVHRHSGDSLQIFPTVERSVLIAKVDEFFGLVPVNALNAGELLFGGCV